MEREKKTSLLQPLLLAHLLVCSVGSKLQHDNLTCYNDYNKNITCVWNSTAVSDLTGTLCTIHAKRVDITESSYSSSCNLEPISVSTPALKKCSLVFNKEGTFQSFHKLSISLSCNAVKQIISYQPYDHIKLNPPGKPEINFTTISWLPQITKHGRITSYISELQWKQKDQLWNDPSVQENTIKNKQCKWDCEAELNSDLIKGETYEARVRVRPADISTSTWSDWSPTVSWVSLTGKTKPPSDVAWSVLGTVTGAAVLALFLTIKLFKTDKTWLHIVKKIRGPPLPNPANSFLQDVNFQSWLSPHFTNESFHSFFKPVEFVSVEVTCNVDGVAPCRPEMALLEKMRRESSYNSTNSSFSYPSYSHLDPPPPVPNLEPCRADTPYGPVGDQGQGRTTEQGRKVEERGKEVEILKLLSQGSSNREPMQIIFDYNNVEKLQVERVRLQSLDSGVCSGEEVSQESLEADSINVTDGHDEEQQGREEREGEDGKDLDFRKLFGKTSTGDIFSKGSIQVCSDYERVQKLQADSNELPSLDSGVSSGGEEQVSQEESLEDIDKPTESTRLLFPPPPFSALPCSLTSFASLPFSFSEPGLSPARQPLPSHILERIAQMSMSVEPCGDGYMPVKQEQN